MSTEVYRRMQASLGPLPEPELTAEMRAECAVQALDETWAAMGLHPLAEPTLEQLETLQVQQRERQGDLEQLTLEMLRSDQRQSARYDRCALSIWRRCLIARAARGAQ